MSKNNLTSFKGKGTAGIPDIESLVRAGIDPKTGKPLAMSDDGKMYEDLRRIFRIIDEQDAVNRFEWDELPTTIDSQQVERLLYYKGQLLLFKFEGVYYFMPYTLDGSIDFYGRYNRVHPVPMTSGVDDDKEKESESYKRKAGLLSQLKIKPIYDLNQIELLGASDPEVSSTKKEGFGVILKDYTNQLSQEITPRWRLNDVLCQLEAEALCFLKTAMVIGTGVKGVRVPDTDSFLQVEKGAKALEKYAKRGIGWIPLVGSIDFQEFADGNRTAINDYFLAMQSIDNLRLATYGLDNSGVFEKQSHILNEENQINQQKYHFVQYDSLKIREKFCEIANKLFGLNISVKVPEEVESQTNTPMGENEEQVNVEEEYDN